MITNLRYRHNMKFYLLVCLAMVMFVHASSQQPKKDTVAGRWRLNDRPGNVNVVDIRDKLVNLALQNPSFEIADRQVNIASQNLKKAKSSILNNVSVQGNLNEFSIAGNSTANGANLFPRYNVGAIIPLGVFLTRSNDIKIARENLYISHAEKNERFRLIKQEVLTKYEDYLLTKSLLELQNQLTEDTHTSFLQMEKAFGEAKIQLEEYTKSYRDYNLEVSKQKNLERDLKVVIIQLESYIGIKLEEALKF